LGKLVEGDDGLQAEEVGEWIADKHELLCDYIQISTYARKKYLPPAGLGGSTCIDLFCGPGRARVRKTGEFIDGGCVAAWQKSVRSGAPFSKVIIGDIDEERLALAKIRLERLGAPVVAILGPAADTAPQAIRECAVGALNFAFLDPYSLGSLDFSIISTLARLYRIDIMVHVSQMDLQRNFDRNSLKDRSALDAFAPGWRDEVDTSSTQRTGRQAYFEYWKRLVSSTGIKTNAEIRLVTGPDHQPLYLLLLATRHDLAHKFWAAVAKRDDGQGQLV
jgi:three-Cys-motif partner protein